MTYALTSGNLDGKFWVICVNCRTEIGTMTGATIARAIEAKGPVLCPDCRERHCEYCGFIQDHPVSIITIKLQDTFKICSECWRNNRDLHQPECEKAVNGNFSAGKRGLSSLPKLNREGQKGEGHDR